MSTRRQRQHEQAQALPPMHWHWLTEELPVGDQALAGHESQEPWGPQGASEELT